MRDFVQCIYMDNVPYIFLITTMEACNQLDQAENAYSWTLNDFRYSWDIYTGVQCENVPAVSEIIQL